MYLFIYCIYIDLFKAFDTVSLPKLIYKLNKLNFHDNIVCWKQNYLSNRKFCVRIYNVISSIHLILYLIVPQGSSLRPLLYVICTDGLVKIIKNCEIFQFADDCKLTKLFCLLLTSYNYSLLQADLDALVKWYNE